MATKNTVSVLREKKGFFSNRLLLSVTKLRKLTKQIQIYKVSTSKLTQLILEGRMTVQAAYSEEASTSYRWRNIKFTFVSDAHMIPNIVTKLVVID